MEQIDRIYETWDWLDAILSDSDNDSLLKQIIRKFSQSDDEEEKKDAEYDKPTGLERPREFTYDDLLD